MNTKDERTDAAPPESPEPSFEDNLQRLESIVAQLEEGNLPLDKTVALYQEAIGAYRACHEALKSAEAEVATLVETLEGELKEEPFEQEEGEE